MLIGDASQRTLLEESALCEVSKERRRDSAVSGLSRPNDKDPEKLGVGRPDDISNHGQVLIDEVVVDLV